MIEEDKFALLNYIYKRKMYLMDFAINNDVFDKCDNCHLKASQIEFNPCNQFVERKQLVINDSSCRIGFLISPKNFCKAKLGVILSNNILITSKEREPDNNSSNTSYGFLNDCDKALIDKHSKKLAMVFKGDQYTKLDEQYSLFLTDYFIFFIKIVKDLKLKQFAVYKIENSILKNVYPDFNESISSSGRFSLIYKTPDIKTFNLIRYMYPNYSFEFLKYEFASDEYSSNFYLLIEDNLIFTEKFQIIVLDYEDINIIQDYVDDNTNINITNPIYNYFINDFNEHLYLQSALIKKSAINSNYIKQIPTLFIDLNKKMLENSLPRKCECCFKAHSMNFHFLSKNDYNSKNYSFDLCDKSKVKSSMMELLYKTMYLRGFNNQMFSIDIEDHNYDKSSIFEHITKPIDCRFNCGSFIIPTNKDTNISEINDPNKIKNKFFGPNYSNCLRTQIYVDDINSVPYYNSGIIKNTETKYSIDAEVETPLLDFSESLVLDYFKISSTYKQFYYLEIISKCNFIKALDLSTLNPNYNLFSQIIKAITLSITIESVDFSDNNIYTILIDESIIEKYPNVRSNKCIDEEINESKNKAKKLKNILSKNLPAFQYLFENMTSNIHELKFNNCNLNDHIMTSCFHSLNNNTNELKLKSINLNFNNLTNESLDAFINAAESHFFKYIKEISIAHNNLTRITKLENLLFLESLNLSENLIEDNEAECLIRLIEKSMSHLRYLSLKDTKISHNFVIKFANALNNITTVIYPEDNCTMFDNNESKRSDNNKPLIKQDPRFEYINFSNIQLNEYCINLLSDYCFDKSKNLHTLSLNNCKIKKISSSFSNNMKFNITLKYLNLSGNELENDSFNNLLDGISLTKLVKLDLSDNMISNFDPEYFSEFLQTTERIIDIDLSHNQLSLKTLKQMCIFIKYYASYTTLEGINLINQYGFNKNYSDYFNYVLKDKYGYLESRREILESQEFKSLNNKPTEEKYTVSIRPNYSINYSNYRDFFVDEETCYELSDFVFERTKLFNDYNEILTNIYNYSNSYLVYNSTDDNSCNSEINSSYEDLIKLIQSKMKDNAKFEGMNISSSNFNINNFYIIVNRIFNGEFADDYAAKEELKKIFEVHKLENMINSIKNKNERDIYINL